MYVPELLPPISSNASGCSCLHSSLSTHVKQVRTKKVKFITKEYMMMMTYRGRTVIFALSKLVQKFYDINCVLYKVTN